MELSEYLQIIKRRVWIIIITMVTTLGVFMYGRQLFPVSYDVSAVLRIIPYAPGDPPYTQLVYAERIMNTYVTIASSKPVLETMRQRLDLEPEQPRNVEASVIPDSELLQITVEDQDPILARDAANMVADLLLNERTIRDIQIYLIEPATLPEPVSPFMDIMYGAIALVVGLVGGAGLAFLFEYLDTRLHTTEQIEAVSGLPILGRIPKTWQIKKSPYLIHKPHFNHGIRSLRTILLLRGTDHPMETILVMSAFPKEGKSTITSNLGISLALAEKSVLIIDADMHYPTIHKIFSINNEIGLSSILEDSVDVLNAVKKTDVLGLSVLTGGPETPKSTELLSSNRMSSLLGQLSEKYDHILIDTPAFLSIPDTATMAPMVDTVLLVTKRGTIKESALRATLHQLEQFGVCPSGVVVNNAKQIQYTRYRKYYRHIKDYDPIADLVVTDPNGIESSVPAVSDKPEAADIKEKSRQINPTNDVEIIKAKIEEGKDNLSEIRGIGPTVEKALNAIGITTFVQLAEQDCEELADRIDGRINTPRIQHDQWIEQARALSTTLDDTQKSDQNVVRNDEPDN